MAFAGKRGRKRLSAKDDAVRRFWATAAPEVKHAVSAVTSMNYSDGDLENTPMEYAIYAAHRVAVAGNMVASALTVLHGVDPSLLNAEDEESLRSAYVATQRIGLKLIEATKQAEAAEAKKIGEEQAKLDARSF